MKKYIPIFISSLLSAFLAIFIYKQFETPPSVIVKNDVGTPQYTNLGNLEDPFSGTKQRNFISAAPTDFTTAARKVTPAVVNIKALESSFNWWGSSSYGASSGSGVIVTEDGYIITNNHVIEDGTRYEVTLNDNREFEATLVGTDPETDLALLKLKTEERVPFLEFGNSDSLQVGEWVLAVGNPFNLESTVTAGIVSAKGRNIDILEGDYSIESFIQTDAAVNPGNSGGALVNTNGELIGINTAIITRSGRYEGYSFAVPCNLAQKVLGDLRDFGSVQRGLLGVRINQVDNQRAKELGLASVEGIYISSVTAGGGAAKAGLQKGDVIIGINDAKVSSIPELQEQVGRFRPGNTIEVEYIRDGRKSKTSVILKDKHNSTSVNSSPVATGNTLNDLGFDLRDLSRDEVRRLRINGVYVKSIDIGSVIEKTEMDPGYIITKVNDTKITSVDDLLYEVNEAKGEKILLEGFYENYPGEYYYTFVYK